MWKVSNWARIRTKSVWLWCLYSFYYIVYNQVIVDPALNGIQVIPDASCVITSGQIPQLFNHFVIRRLIPVCNRSSNPNLYVVESSSPFLFPEPARLQVMAWKEQGVGSALPTHSGCTVPPPFSSSRLWVHPGLTAGRVKSERCRGWCMQPAAWDRWAVVGIPTPCRSGSLWCCWSSLIWWFLLRRCMWFTWRNVLLHSHSIHDENASSLLLVLSQIWSHSCSLLTSSNYSVGMWQGLHVQCTGNDVCLALRMP